MKRFCITGGIACGKSAAAARLAAVGWQVIDADVIAREQLQPGAEGYKKTVDAFGKNILNDARLVDRTLLGRLVFADAGKRVMLNSILHPLIRAVVEQRLQAHGRRWPGVPAVTVIPLLHETDGAGRFDSVACVAATPAGQLARLRARGLDEDAAKQRMRAQWPVEEKIRHSQLVLWNNGSFDLLDRQVARLQHLWLSS
ncbi:MAG: dephospho-CoA kinase [Verrucomicrobiales bacterium]|jgi:dephospho-CoA kinase|nr:dephospho-CoA kinase [Verrucomicrobiales bacterium]